MSRTNRTLPRREFLRAVLVAGMATGAAPLLGSCAATPRTTGAPATTFGTPLPVPPIAPSRVVDGRRVFSLTARTGESEFVPGLRTPTWGFDGPYLGPTLRMRRGEQVAVEVRNELPEATTVHWHGMHLPAAMDGGPHQMIEPGGTWRPTWRVDQPAATLWYHPHPHGATEEHVYRGLAGVVIVDDPEDEAALPGEYGVDDVPVIVQDKELDDDGQLVLDSEGNEVGLLGSTVLANGVVGAVHEVTTELVRLRLLNGSTGRTYEFGLDDDRTFLLVASDGGLLREPYETGRVRLSPGERAEIVVAFAPGDDVMLASFPPDLGDVVLPSVFGGTDRFDVLRLRAATELRPSPPVPGHLASFGLVADEAVATRSFELQDRQVNGHRMDMERIDTVVRVGTTEVWEVVNLDRFPHNWHVHDVQFEVLSIDGAAPPPELAGRKDTVYLEPRRRYRLVMRFEDFADPEVPYMYHCHLLLHEDEGLMGQFLVTDTAATTSVTDGTGADRGADPGRTSAHGH